jgi:hypothetical protein
MRKLVLAAAFLLLFCGQAKAQITGTEIAPSCAHEEALCTGYVIGAFEAMQTFWNHPSFCIPKGVSNNQLVSVFKKYLADRPENFEKSAVILVAASFVLAFPCGKVENKGTP